MNSRICKKCKFKKSLKDFVFRKDVPSKRKHICKECHRIKSLKWKQANKEQVNKSNLKRYYKNRKRYKAKNLEWQRNNKEKANARTRRWTANNPKKRRAIEKRYADNHPGYSNHKAAKRRAVLIDATPPWADLAEIAKVYERCAEISKKTGIEHHVDHIVPLNGKNVCGLHVHWNLQILTKIENIKKGNKVLV